MRNLTAFALVCLIGCASYPDRAEADTVTVSWENPATNTDGTAIPLTGPGSLTKATLVYGTCNAASTAIATVKATIDVPMPATSKVTNMPVGVSCVHATVTNTYGETSDPSNVVAHTAPFTKPGPARNLTVIKSS